MNIRVENGLLLASCTLNYKKNELFIENVLLDTGCAVSVFDVDIVEDIGIHPDRDTAKIVKMYGVGGKSESCIEQPIHNLNISGHHFHRFYIQLGPIKSTYGFDAILGNDFLIGSGLMLDLANLAVVEPTRFDMSILN